MLRSAIADRQVLSCLHTLMTLIKESLAKNHSRADIRMVMTEAWKFCQPMHPGGERGEQRPVPWIFEQNNAATQSTMKFINEDMTQSTLLRKASCEAAKEEGRPSSSASAPSKRRKAKSLAGDHQRREAISALVPSDSDSRRARTWVDDLIMAVHYAFDQSGVPPCAECADRRRTTHFVLSLALEFCWVGHIVINSKTITAWTALRSELQAIVKTAAGTFNSYMASLDDSAGSSEAGAQTLEHNARVTRAVSVQNTFTKSCVHVHE